MLKSILVSLGILFISSQLIYAYTTNEVSQHNTSSDCWVIFDNNVYDITEYIRAHDRYLNIRSWCGTDMTQAFMTKDNTGRDHKSSTYALLENYKIGTLSNTSIQTNTPAVENTTSPTQEFTNEEAKVTSQNNQQSNGVEGNTYNIVIPLLLSLSLYWIPYFMIKKSNPIKIKSFNGFWNSILIFLLLIPAFGFGVYMILRYKFPTLWNTTFDFMYWHVELSLVMGILAINHFLQRFKTYIFQIKK